MINTAQPIANKHIINISNYNNMKKSIKLLALAAFSLLTFTACDNDDDDHIRVPDNFSLALTAKYPTAQKIEWEKKGEYYVAECRVNGEEKEVWFDALGEWKMTETEIFWNSLPVDVQTSFNSSDYATWHRDDYDMLEYPTRTTLYVIEVEQGKTEYQLFYTENGTLEEAKDVTHQSDEHWPE